MYKCPIKKSLLEKHYHKEQYKNQKRNKTFKVFTCIDLLKDLRPTLKRNYNKSSIIW